MIPQPEHTADAGTKGAGNGCHCLPDAWVPPFASAVSVISRRAKEEQMKLCVQARMKSFSIKDKIMTTHKHNSSTFQEPLPLTVPRAAELPMRTPCEVENGHQTRRHDRHAGSQHKLVVNYDKHSRLRSTCLAASLAVLIHLNKILGKNQTSHPNFKAHAPHHIQAAVVDEDHHSRHCQRLRNAIHCAASVTQEWTGVRRK